MLAKAKAKVQEMTTWRPKEIKFFGLLLFCFGRRKKPIMVTMTNPKATNKSQGFSILIGSELFMGIHDPVCRKEYSRNNNNW